VGLTLMMALASTVEMPGVTFTAIHSFSDSDGRFPRSRLLMSSNVLYGTTSSGGAYGGGTVFRINTDGTGFTNLHDFDGTNGWAPVAGLVLSGGTLYGTTTTPGGTTDGTVFTIQTDGTAFSVLFRFPGFLDGLSPEGELLLSKDTLFGTTRYGSSYGDGTVFSFTPAGTAFSTLHVFSGSDGAQSMAGLALSGDTLYGTTALGNGTIFSVKTNGTGFTNLYTFGPQYLYIPLVIYTNTDGGSPHSTLVVDGENLYGTSTSGGAGGRGTVFRIRTDGTGFTSLHSFEPYAPDLPGGGSPEAGLVLSSNRLYGVTKDGVLFALNPDGTAFTNLYTLNGGTDGFSTWGPLMISGHVLYGVASFGGTEGRGTVFALNLLDAIPLQILQQANGVILSWTNALFTLQEASSALGPFSTVQSATNSYTNTISDPQKFYRLQGN
jgi:uncharacterized repeat protein (TIGR03803 family)